MNTNKKLKKTFWAFVVYPESLPNDWLDILALSGLKIAVSPLHDKDLNADMTEKKAHYHIVVAYNNPTTYNNVLRFTEQLNGTIPIALESVKGYYNYLTHKDNPEKVQYDSNDILLFNDFDTGEYDFTLKEQVRITKELINFIESNSIFEYADFVNLVLEYLKDEDFLVAKSNSYFFVSYLRSKRHSHYSSVNLIPQEIKFLKEDRKKV